MVKTVAAARKAARKAIESTYEGVCTIVERRDMRDEVTKITRKAIPNFDKAIFKEITGIDVDAD